ncbi:MAG: A/G-specific adenine glycosylase [Dehalococcoidales bacterium]|nr:A/G-specific adenine glycosylase [Dehalococcoidales bacterium]
MISLFQEIILKYFREHSRHFPWRETHEPYHILVSEFMLQQTQTSRVLTKYHDFIQRFPDFRRLADASLTEVLQAWQGLGYNRRARSLHRLAKMVVSDYAGQLPDTVEQLRGLPGIGTYTAAAVMAIAFNKPAVGIDTNIRTVFHYFFFHDAETVNDREILPLVEATVDSEQPREWYYALYDFGVMLKQTEKGVYGTPRTRQRRFKGSDRQVRGQILKTLLTEGKLAVQDLKAALDFEDDRIERITLQLQDECFLTMEDGYVQITE